MKIAAIVITALLCVGGTAHADWQYTKWGMSTAELQALSPNIIPTEPASRSGLRVMGLGDAMLYSGYSAAEIPFTAYYYFSNDKLVAVSLRTKKDDDGVRTRERLKALYGAPDNKNRFTGCEKTQWRDQKLSNAVTFFECPSIDSYEVRYEPIPKNSGL
jgi:hypothetical protein